MSTQNDSFYGCSIHKLNEYFQFLLKIEKDFGARLEDENKLKIEAYKLAIMQSMLSLLKPKMRKTSHKIKKRSVPKIIFAWISALINPIIAGVGGFSLCDKLLALIPGLLNPISLVLGIVCGLLGGFLNIGFSIIKYRKSMGISPFKLRAIFQLYRDQLTARQSIQSLMLSSQCSHRHSANDYLNFQKTINLFNQDIKAKQTQLTECHQKNSIRKGIKWLISGVNAVLSAGSGFFFGKELLILFGGAVLVSGPLGWIVGSVTAIFSVASFFYLQRKSIFNLIDRLAGHSRKLRCEQRKFIKKIKQFDQKMLSVIQMKQKNEAETEQLNQKIADLQSKLDTKVRYPVQNKNQSNDSKYSTSVSSHSIFKPNKLKKGKMIKNDFNIETLKQPKIT